MSHQFLLPVRRDSPCDVLSTDREGRLGSDETGPDE